MKTLKKMVKIVFNRKGRIKEIIPIYGDMRYPVVRLEIFDNGRSRFVAIDYKKGLFNYDIYYYEMNFNFLDLNKEFREHIWRWFMRGIMWEPEYVNKEIIPITKKGCKRFEKWLEEVEGTKEVIKNESMQNYSKCC